MRTTSNHKNIISEKKHLPYFLHPIKKKEKYSHLNIDVQTQFVNLSVRD